jgi:hypothetical protein
MGVPVSSASAAVKHQIALPSRMALFFWLPVTLAAPTIGMSPPARLYIFKLRSGLRRAIESETLTRETDSYEQQRE